jgi:hypothetical protein
MGPTPASHGLLRGRTRIAPYLHATQTSAVQAPKKRWQFTLRRRTGTSSAQCNGGTAGAGDRVRAEQTHGQAGLSTRTHGSLTLRVWYCWFAPQGSWVGQFPLPTRRDINNCRHNHRHRQLIIAAVVIRQRYHHHHSRRRRRRRCRRRHRRRRHNSGFIVSVTTQTLQQQ